MPMAAAAMAEIEDAFKGSERLETDKHSTLHARAKMPTKPAATTAIETAVANIGCLVGAVSH